MLNSKSNEQVKMLASLKDKKHREKHSKYIIEGVKLVGEMMDLGGITPSESIVYSNELLKSAAGGEKLLERIEKSTLNTLEVSKEVFKYIADTESPQGVMCVKNIPVVTDKEKLNQISSMIKSNKKFLVLDKVQDSGNLGTIIRSAVTFGIDCIICIKGTTDIYNPKVVRSTMGAIEKVNVMYLGEEEYEQVVKQFKENRYEIVSTELSAKKYLNELDYSKNIVFVMGNEANGVSEKIHKMCTEYIKIPISDAQESLNVAVATGICLYSAYITNA